VAACTDLEIVLLLTCQLNQRGLEEFPWITELDLEEEVVGDEVKQARHGHGTGERKERK